MTPARRVVPVIALAALSLGLLMRPAQSPPHVSALDEVTFAQLQDRLTRGATTSRRLVEQYVARIEAIDRKGPALNSVIELNPDALAIADRLDQERKAGHVRGPLHGIPIVVKDNIATGDRMRTSAGSLALADARAPHDAFLIERLRAAGAVILAKTNLSEWANFRSTRSTSGWSGRGGLTRNPYALDRNPSGSSSGSAVAVAANLAAAGVGTETDGSIVSPAHVNGLVGIKPTVGLVSRTGIVPISHSQDTAGPMARTVADAAALLTVMAAVDPADTATSAAGRSQVDYARALDANGLRGARIGVMRARYFGGHPAADALAEAAIAEMRRQGAVIVDPADVPTVGAFDESELEVLLYEFKAGIPAFFTWWGPGAPVSSVSDIMRFNRTHPAEELRYFGQDLLERADARGPLTDAAYVAALARGHELSRAQGIDAVMNAQQLDALVAPTGGPAWLTDLVNGDGGTASAPAPSSLAAVAGYPHVTVPMGFEHGLPLGLSFIGRAWSEATLIRLAYAYEQATHHRRAPTFAPTAPVPR
ncbi:MAG: amidase [Acidobacteria bacterium]|nr:amidase [Acidobacteriota bacterium]